MYRSNTKIHQDVVPVQVRRLESVTAGTSPTKETILAFALLALAIPPAIDLLRGDVRPLRWLVAYLVFGTIGAVTYGAWKLWPDRIYVRIALGVLSGAAAVTVVFLVAVLMT